MMNLVEDILDLSRLEFDKFELMMSTFSIKEKLQEAMSMIRHKAASKRIEITSVFSDLVPSKIVADAKRIH